ncbi:MAG: hypothetical protein U9N62_08740 [Thermotogota bacterium]|nr:hypothetical protein [Thermotogota bacterium]
MKKFFLMASVVIILSGLVFSVTTEIRMLNGDTFVCELNTEELVFITDFSEISFSTLELQEILFTSPQSELTEIRTIYLNEKFTGLLVNRNVEITTMGNTLTILKDKIDRITFNNASENIIQYQMAVYLRTGDFFYGELLLTNLKIKTSYGTFTLDPKKMAQINFEGAGKVTTSVRMSEGNEIKGIIQNDYLPMKLLGEQIIQIVPDKIDRIVFKRN